MRPVDVFKSVGEAGSAEVKVKGSRFIAEALPISSEEEAEERIAHIAAREHAATHHCWAYRIGVEAGVYRYNDDGEPSGTAGMPILRQLEGRDLTYTLVVVTRYFGGTKLGTGGLARAYGEAAAAVLERTKLAEHVISERVNVSFKYDDTAPAMQCVERFDAKVLESRYTERTELTLAVPQSRVDAFVSAFIDALGARGAVETLEGD